jgi:hypothetical protein
VLASDGQDEVYVTLNSESFDRRAIRLQRCIEINFDLRLISNYKACKLSERFLKFVLAIFPAKSCYEFLSYRSAVIVVEGLGCGRATNCDQL